MQEEAEARIRSVLESFVQAALEEKRRQAKEAGLEYDTLLLLESVWRALVRGKPQAIAKGVDPRRLEEELLIVREILDERREEIANGADGELLRTMAPILDDAVERIVRERFERGEAPSRLEAVDEALERLKSNVKALLPFTDCNEDDVMARITFLERYAETLRQIEREMPS